MNVAQHKVMGGGLRAVRNLPGYLTTYAALIFNSIQHSTLAPITTLIYTNPNSRFSTDHAARRYPLAFGIRAFLWIQAVAKVREIFPHWDKRENVLRD